MYILSIADVNVQRHAYYHSRPQQREADHHGYHSRFRHAFNHGCMQTILQLIAPQWSKYMTNRCTCFVLGMCFFWFPPVCFFFLKASLMPDLDLLSKVRLETSLRHRSIGT